MLAAGPAFAQAEPAPTAEAAENAEPARIPFANRGGVRDWKAEGRDVIYFHDRQRNWYKAELFSSAVGLQFVQFIGIDTGPTDTLDRFSSVWVDGQKYALRSLVAIEGEPPKKKG